MGTHVETILRTFTNGSGLLESLAWKSVVILALIFVATACWRRSAAAARHLAWTTGFVCLLCLPAFMHRVPSWRAPAWIVPSSLNSVFIRPLTFNSTPAAHPESGPPSARSGTARDTSSSAAASAPITSAPRQPVEWGGLAVAVWLIGIGLGLLRFLAVHIRLHQWFRRSFDCEKPQWLELLEALRRDLRIRRSVRLRVAEGAATPMTWGLWQPVVLLPEEAGIWPEERLRLVLSHELAHVKRWDCLTQEIARVACLLYWFNPLARLGARRMRAERERACDDQVLNAGARPSEYAGHLVDIAHSLVSASLPSGAVAMARRSGLEQRVRAILDQKRNRRRIAGAAAISIVLAVLGMELLVGGCATRTHGSKTWSLEHSAIAAQWKHFVAEKQSQESALVRLDEKDFAKDYADSPHRLIRPNCQPFFSAAAKGDWLAVSNLWSKLEKHTFGLGPTNLVAGYPRGMWLQPIREIYGTIRALAVSNEKYSRAFGNDIIQSIPPGSIYFGGTDPGRFVVTALQKSQIKAEPFFTLTQNALADGTYLEYLRSMYGSKIYTPTSKDSQQCFMNYIQDATRRLHNHELKPGEHVKETQGRIQVRGVVAVMQINGLLVKVIFDKNPHRQFYIEQSWALDWMYPHLEPHGLIFKINRQPLAKLPDDVVRRDHEYWTRCVQPMIGDWLGDDTSVKEVVAFALRVFLNHNFSGFHGDPQFVENAYACKMFAKERLSIAGLYVWRMHHAKTSAEKKRMAREADFAFRQAFALCPYMPKTAKEYEQFLKSQGRQSDAALVSETAARFPDAAQSDKSRSRKGSVGTAKPPIFQMRLAQHGPSADTTPMMLVTPRSGSNPNPPRRETLYVRKKILLDTTAVQSAKVTRNRFGPRIDITLTPSGQKRFAQITRQNLRKRLAIIIDGQLCMAPIIQQEISGSVVTISGSFSDAEAEAFVRKINGALGR